MTSNDTPATGRSPRPGRRRALGRGPGAAPPAARPADAGVETDTEGTEREAAAGAHRAAAPPAAVRAPVAARTPGPAPADRDDVPGPDAGPPFGTALAAPGTGDGPAGPGTAPVAASGAGAADEATAAGAAEAAEAEDDGRFKVRLSNFEGPFDLLLQLISKHRLDVTEVALSRVTDEFMAYIRALGPDWDLDETTEFLVVAATLLDLKAARLLPAAEVEDEADLALLEARDLLFARLLQYRAYKRIAEIFSRRLDEEARRHPRTVGLEPQHAELLPEVVIGIGAQGFARLAVKAMQPRPKPQVYVDHIHAPLVSVQEQAGIVVARLKELGEAGFWTLTEDTDDTLTVVARFLALLELYREKAVALDQETALGELTVRWTGGDGDAAPTVTDEFDRPPGPPEEPQKEPQEPQKEKREGKT
ncbi:segregation and condensation protein A [Streptomyces sp. NEAU-W12]|uniref:segregation and condensation protein A n=1 Tax=Streptomyces sp. NEAU-W12 TaxID=2994668 RepID=UPI00224B1A93|nr:segregation/condensation protein A [Streptomyces sp. NEAU-W12]MCX2925773.1 segregation/condensation protein A [Streptomyces sp. NEAU-W12]